MSLAHSVTMYQIINGSVLQLSLVRIVTVLGRNWQVLNAKTVNVSLTFWSCIHNKTYLVLCTCTKQTFAQHRLLEVADEYSLTTL